MPFPISVTSKYSIDKNEISRTVVLHSGLTVIVGPNGSGKTVLLRGLKQSLNACAAGKRVRYISAGRASPLEQYRSDYDGFRGNAPRYDDANYGSASDAQRRHNYETLQGDFQTLAARPDIQIKVRERLRKLFGRDIVIAWDGGQLKIRFMSTSGGTPYSSAREASGLLHMVGMLSALYDDEVGVLLVDEPEVSLHPQLQAFVLREMAAVCGLPSADTNKKLIVLATHSTEFLRLDSPDKLPTFVFCHEFTDAPVQISPDAGELKSKKIFALIARMGQEHKLALFAKSPLLVEGPSDAIICSGLANRCDISLEAGGSQLLPVIGKGQFPVVVKLLRLLGKSPIVLADADGIADGLDLANMFLSGPGVSETVTAMGFATGMELAARIYGDFCALVDRQWEQIRPLAEGHPYWTARNQTDGADKVRRRAALCCLLTYPDTALSSLGAENAWVAMKRRVTALLDVLEGQGCFVLRRGTIESYYRWAAAAVIEKPSAAAEEVAHFGEVSPESLEDGYADVLRCLRRASSTKPIVEAESLQDLLLAAVAPALGRVRAGAGGSSLNGFARSTLGDQATLLDLAVADGKLMVKLNSKILDVRGFPMIIERDDDVVKKVSLALGLS